MSFLFLWLCVFTAQAEPRFFSGGGVGIAILSADSKAIVRSDSSAFSNYAPKKGLLAHGFGGVHLNDYLSVQGAWNWNRNELTFTAKRIGPDGGAYDQTRRSSQHNLGADLLLYFRDRRSWVRPFLTVGMNHMWLSSEERAVLLRNGTLAPPPNFEVTQIGLRVAAGADLRLPRGFGFRYAFNEILQRNGISRQLSPAGTSPLMNFQHLFGFFRSF